VGYVENASSSRSHKSRSFGSLLLGAFRYDIYFILGWSWWQEKRKVWVDQSKIKYLLVGAIDCAIGTLPYVSYVATLYLLDALKLW